MGIFVIEFLLDATEIAKNGHDDLQPHRQIAAELELNENCIQEMTTVLRNGIVEHESSITLEGTVECDEARGKVRGKILATLELRFEAIPCGSKTPSNQRRIR